MAAGGDAQYLNGIDSIAQVQYNSKLRYEKGLKSLPDRCNLKGWENNPSLWPDVVFGNIYTYLIETPGIYTKESLKAFKLSEVYQFFVSGYLKPLWYHAVGENVSYCFIKRKVIPSQRTTRHTRLGFVLAKGSI